MNKVLFTGGGTVGHVSVNVALIPEFEKNGYKISYIGSKDGIEKTMIEKFSNVNYYEISSGKLRRYFDWKNFTDPFKVIKGIYQSIKIIKKENPNFIFSKGGFVSVPVCIASKILNIPIILHESDLTPGLANKINIKFSNHIFTTFEKTLNYLPKYKSSFGGAIVRDDIYNGDKEKGYKLCGFPDEKPIILIMGGSLGSKIINEFIWKNLDELLKTYHIIHLVGKNSYNANINKKGYVQFEFLKSELFDIFKIVDFTISRAGANSIYEFLALNLPSILIPLGKNQSRGDQVDNSKFFEENGFSKVIFEEDLSTNSVKEIIDFFDESKYIKKNIIEYKNKKKLINSVQDFYKKIIDVLED